MPPNASDALQVEVDEDPPRGRFKLLGNDSQLLGQMTFSRARDDLIIIDHTEVEDPPRGKGGGLRLFNGMVDWARNTGTKIMSTCPFANSMFDRHSASRDVLA
jgi:predicted GNAT family acetyltransferase